MCVLFVLFCFLFFLFAAAAIRNGRRSRSTNRDRIVSAAIAVVPRRQHAYTYIPSSVTYIRNKYLDTYDRVNSAGRDSPMPYICACTTVVETNVVLPPNRVGHELSDL